MIEGDSIEYNLIEKVCSLITTEKPFTCEIGVRLGKGSQTILESLKHKDHWHIGIDPYGDLDYEHFDKDAGVEHKDGTSPTYPNSMKTTLLQNIGFDNFTLFQMSDTDFMNNKGFIILDDYPTYKFDLLIKVAELIDIKPMHIWDNKIVMRKY